MSVSVALTMHCLWHVAGFGTAMGYTFNAHSKVELTPEPPKPIPADDVTCVL